MISGAPRCGIIPWYQMGKFPLRLHHRSRLEGSRRYVRSDRQNTADCRPQGRHAVYARENVPAGPGALRAARPDESPPVAGLKTPLPSLAQQAGATAGAALPLIPGNVLNDGGSPEVLPPVSFFGPRPLSDPPPATGCPLILPPRVPSSLARRPPPDSRQVAGTEEDAWQAWLKRGALTILGGL
jgi:hypothetical protein